MRKMPLGKTNLMVTKTAFGALPLQRCSVEDAAELLHAAKEAGINFFDTAREYTDSEKKLGLAFQDCRNEVIIATKTHAESVEEMKMHLETSLKMLETDYIDLYQFHNVKEVPKEESPMYQYMLELKKQGVIKHIGATSHTYDSALTVIESGLYETLQYPLFCLSNEKDLGLIEKCRANNMGVIAMKGMGGGLIDDPKVAFSFFEGYSNVCTIWGIQTRDELSDFIELEANPAIINEQIKQKLKSYKKELNGEFCRSCGYCLSACPVGIEISNCARMTQLCGRAVWQDFVTEQWQAKMQMINDCIECRACVEKCPYSFDIPNLLKKNLREYNEFLKNENLA